MSINSALTDDFMSAIDESDAIPEEYYQMKVNASITAERKEIDFMFSNLRVNAVLPAFDKLNKFSKKLFPPPAESQERRTRRNVEDIEGMLAAR